MCVCRRVCLYLGNVCGCSSTQRFRGDCLSSHQHSRLTITITIQLVIGREKKRVRAVDYQQKTPDTAMMFQMKLDFLQKQNKTNKKALQEGERIDGAMHWCYKESTSERGEIKSKHSHSNNTNPQFYHT